MAESYEGFKLCHPDDLVINIMWAWMGALGVSSNRGIVSSSYGVYRLRDKSCFDSVYLDYLVRIPEYIAEYHRISQGIRSSRLRMYSDDFFQIPIVCPPIDEQRQIVTYINQKLAQIDQFICYKLRLIELLNEQKTVMINRAVTKGLDPDVPMKPSGIEWLGEIPAHWEIKKIKYCASIQNGQVDPRKTQYQNMILIAPNHIESGTGRLLFQEAVKEQSAESGKYFYKDKDVLYSKIRPALKKVCLATGEGLCSADMYPITTKKYIMPNFLLYFLLGERFSQFAIESSMRVAMPKINREDLLNCPVIYPSLDKQAEIVKYIEYQFDIVNQAISKAEKEIELIQEYRTTLISDAVTGKIDIRDTLERGVAVVAGGV